MSTLHHPTRPATTKALLVALVVLAALLSPVAAPRPAAAADGVPEIVVTGRGWGHGRGMGQYGALGYATDFGWTSGQILDHYYGGTVSGPAPVPGVVDPGRVRVDLVSLRDRATTIALDDGTLHLMAADGATLQRLTGAVRLTVTGGNLALETAPGCDGPWTAQPPIERDLVRIAAETSGTGQAGLLQGCGPSHRTWYEGELWATSTSGRQRTVNAVTIEQYLRGVVPNEVPASWHRAALEAQAVAARSYALAGDSRWSGYADTCDSTLCQVYDGRFTTRGGGLRAATHPRTDEAIAATAGIVRLRGNGSVARTEFSSSTGGHTVGGDFPAVADRGDAVAANPNRAWQVTVDLRSVESAYGLGDLTGLSVLRRNGLGADGGRVLSAQLRFERGSVTLTGDQLRRRLGLKSNWFSLGQLTRGGVAVFDEVSLDEANERFVRRAFEHLGGRAVGRRRGGPLGGPAPQRPPHRADDPAGQRPALRRGAGRRPVPVGPRAPGRSRRPGLLGGDDGRRPGLREPGHPVLRLPRVRPPFRGEP